MFKHKKIFVFKHEKKSSNKKTIFYVTEIIPPIKSL